MGFIMGVFQFIGMMITFSIIYAGIGVWLETKKEEATKKETVMGPLPKVDPDSFHAKWANWMLNTTPQEDIVGTIEWERKYQPKS